MRYFLRALPTAAFFCSATALFCLPVICGAQPVKRADLATVLNFEGAQSGGPPRGWGGGPRETMFADDQVVHGGKWSARLERNASSANAFRSITLAIPVDFAGKQVELRGFLKTEDVADFAGLWLREDGDGKAVAFDNMQNRGLKGTTDWKEYSIVLPLRSEAQKMVFGVLSSGIGKTWADDLQLLVDGKPIWELPVVEKPKTPIDLDHEFDAGSKIMLRDLSKVQIDNLATLGRVWGFLKYHHPAVASGQRQWDYDLFRILPRIVAAVDRTAANEAMHEWVASLGAVTDCKPCANLSETSLAMKPDVDWVSDEKLLGSKLSQDLRNVYRNRIVNKFYLSLGPGVGNPVFEHEPVYPRIQLPDAGFQLLALYRFWNIVQYWYPNRDIVGENWNSVLSEFIPRVTSAWDPGAYKREMMQLIGQIHDTHANLWSSLAERPPVGTCQLPVLMRFVEGSAVVSGYSAAPDPDSVFRIGDVMTELDGTAVSTLVERWRPFYADSNEAARLRDIGRQMTQGACGPTTIGIRRGSETLTVTASRVPVKALTPGAGGTHDRAGETFQKLSSDVAYLKLSSVKSADAAKYVDLASGTKGMIIDIRNYPSEFMVFALGALLVEQPTEFVRFTFIDVVNPGATIWGKPLSLTPAQPAYKGKIVILVDDVSQSQAEYTTMALRSTPGAIVVGSTTAGADGNVSQIPLPGGLSTMISGLGVFYPDKKPTQQVGIVADVQVKPTIEGIRAGRDEVLESGLRQILGPDVTDAQIQAMAKR